MCLGVATGGAWDTIGATTLARVKGRGPGRAGTQERILGSRGHSVSARLVVIGDELARLAREAGVEIVVAPDVASVSPSTADAVITSDPEALLPWRTAGHTVGIVAVCGSVTARALLEPIEVVPALTADALRLALASLEAGAASGRLALETGTLDLSRRRLERTDGSEVALSQREVDLVAYLAARRHRDVDRDELRTQVWGHRSTKGRTRAVDMAVVRLRRKIERDPTSPRHLLAVRGGGYRYEAGEVEVPPERVLPGREGRLVGRTRLLAEVSATLAVTQPTVLVGPPGVGKTRLALELAHTWSTGRVVWVDLTPVASLVDACAAVCRGLDMSLGRRTDPVERVVEVLALQGPGLLVLDNAEHLAEPLAEVLIHWAERTRVLVTSQVRLPGLAQHVEPLGLEDARALFLDRAGAGAHEGLEDLLVPLDGLPLAIELAAARSRTLPVEELARLLDRRRSLLGREARGVPEAMGWAWHLLDDDARQDLAALAVLPGELDLAQAAVLLGAEPTEALPRVERLVGRSVVQRRGDTLRLLEAVRGHALAEGGAWTDFARARLSAWVVGRAGEQLARVGRKGGREAVAWLTRHRPALVLNSGSRSDDVQAVTTIALALDQVYRANGTPPQRLAVLGSALARATEASDLRCQGLLREAWAEAQSAHAPEASIDTQMLQAAEELVGAGAPVESARVRVRCAQFYAERSRLEDSLALVQDADAMPAPARWVAVALRALMRDHLGRPEGALMRAANIRAAVAALERADELSLALNAAQYGTIIATNRGDPAEARALRERMVEIHTHLADRAAEGTVQRELGVQALGAGEFETAYPHLMRAVDLLSVHGRSGEHSQALLFQAVTALHLQRHVDAAARVQRLLTECALRGDARNACYALVVRGCIELDLHRLEAARETAAEVEAALPETGSAVLRGSVRALVGLSWLAEGDGERARAALAHLPKGSGRANLVQARAALAVEAAVRGDTSEATVLLSMLDNHPVGCRAHWYALGGRLLEGVSTVDLVGSHVHTLVRVLARVADRDSNVG